MAVGQPGGVVTQTFELPGWGALLPVTGFNAGQGATYPPSLGIKSPAPGDNQGAGPVAGRGWAVAVKSWSHPPWLNIQELVATKNPQTHPPSRAMAGQWPGVSFRPDSNWFESDANASRPGAGMKSSRKRGAGVLRQLRRKRLGQYLGWRAPGRVRQCSANAMCGHWRRSAERGWA